MHTTCNNTNPAPRRHALPAAFALSTLLSACGGGGGAGSPPETPPTALSLSLSGTAAVGMALPAAKVQIKCDGASTETSTLADGSYRVQLAGASLPCALRVTATGNPLLHSVALGDAREAVAHITPLTELLLSRAAAQDAFHFFDKFDPKAAKTKLTPSVLKSAQDDVRDLLGNAVNLAGLADFFSSPLKPSLPGSPSNDPHDIALEVMKDRIGTALLSEYAQLLASGKPVPAPPPFTPTLKLPELSISLETGQSHTFSVETNYPPGVRYLRQPITWSVVEAGGGRIDPKSGAYTAPDKPGVYHLSVVRDDFSGIGASVTVTVVEKGAFVPTLKLPAGGFTVRQGESATFKAETNYAPGVYYIRQPVRWSLLGADAGRIDAVTGQYTAPGKSGWFHVKVTREDWPGISAVAGVRVQNFSVLDYFGGYVTSSNPLDLTNIPDFKPEFTVVRDEASLSALVARLGLQRPPQSTQVVDFARDMVVVLYPGMAPDGCKGLEAIDVRQQDSKLVVEYRKTLAPAGVFCTQAIVPLAKVLAVPKSNLPLVYVELPPVERAR